MRGKSSVVRVIQFIKALLNHLKMCTQRLYSNNMDKNIRDGRYSISWKRSKTTVSADEWMMFVGSVDVLSETDNKIQRALSLRCCSSSVDNNDVFRYNSTCVLYFYATDKIQLSQKYILNYVCTKCIKVGYSKFKGLLHFS